ncbi:hypothetical protein AN219_37470 [Streptomyces nanshensis]|nr:hypothetical protein AN219_37470 [Streptomyces nanshensis]
MPDPEPDLPPEPPDGDVYVSPRHLAGSTAIGDPGLQPLLDLGWAIRHDDLGNAYVSAPDHTVRLAYLPEGDDDRLWCITAYTDPFASPRWGVCFNDRTPTEFVIAFTTALAASYAAGYDAHLRGQPGTAQSPFDPLLQQNWEVRPFRRIDSLELTSPDGMARITYDRDDEARLDHEAELTTLGARWLLRGGPELNWWYATASTHTPKHLVTAITTAVADPAPVLRWEGELPRAVREHAHVTPVAPPRAPVPTPLDVHRRHTTARPDGRRPVSVPRWSTTTGRRAFPYAA